MGSLALLSGAVGNCSHRRRGYRPVHLAKGGLYGSCLHCLQATHLAVLSGEAYRRRMAAYPAVPEVCTTNRSAPARLAAVARGDSTATALVARGTILAARCLSAQW